VDTPGGKFRIVVADDTRYWRQKITDVLERSGHEVIAVENGRSAIRLCMDSERPVDLVVVDLVMPGMDGFEVARVLRSLPNASKQRIIGVTDVIRPKDSNDPAQRKNFNAIIEKSANLDQILFLLNKYLHTLHLERRPRPRIPTNIPAVFRTRDRRGGSCVIVNLSSSGAYLSTPTPIAVGKAVTLNFTLPNGTAIRTSVVVFWVNDDETRASEKVPDGMGVLFIGMKPEGQAAIDKFVKGELAHF
jgi:uncharacterized protein (TIGR02266 family)